MALKQPVSIDGIEFDALIEQNEQYDSDIPQYPVEAGYVVSDNVTLKPLQLTMTLFVTNTPVTHAMRHGIHPFRVDLVEARLLQMRDKKDVVTIVTCDKTYKDMGLTSLSIPKTVSGSREISVTFQKVIKTYTQMVAIPSSYGKSGATGATAGTAKTSSAGLSGGNMTGLAGLTGKWG
jgi:hypothetical protein